MARVSIRPVEALEMKFADGTIKKALFNNEAFINYTNEFGTLDDKAMEEIKNKPYDAMARFLYCGMKVFDKTVTLEEAEYIVIGGGESLAAEICTLMIDNFLATSNEETKKKLMKEIQKVNKLIMQ